MRRAAGRRGCRRGPPRARSRVAPTPLSNPKLLAVSQSALARGAGPASPGTRRTSPTHPPRVTLSQADTIELDPAETQRDDFAAFFCGNKLLPGAEPAAHCYCGACATRHPDDAPPPRRSAPRRGLAPRRLPVRLFQRAAGRRRHHVPRRGDQLAVRRRNAPPPLSCAAAATRRRRRRNSLPPRAPQRRAVGDPVQGRRQDAVLAHRGRAQGAAVLRARVPRIGGDARSGRADDARGHAGELGHARGARRVLQWQPDHGARVRRAAHRAHLPPLRQLRDLQADGTTPHHSPPPPRASPTRGGGPCARRTTRRGARGRARGWRRRCCPG